MSLITHLIKEELTGQQRAEFRSQFLRPFKVGGKHTEFSDHVFPKVEPVEYVGKDNNTFHHTQEHNHPDKYKGHRIYIPLQHEESDFDVNPHPVVKRFVEDQGFAIHDYKNKMARDKHGRSVKIGKILSKANAPDHVLNHFKDDFDKNTVSAKRHKDLHVCISRHPEDVAAMSTNRGWTSCMNDDFDQMHNEVQAGTHVAYLVKKTDTGTKNALARIALRPYVDHHGYENETYDGDVPKGSHVVLHPATSSYGAESMPFHRTVRKWAEENFPKKSKVYQLRRGSYNDEGYAGQFLLSKEPHHVHESLDTVANFDHKTGDRKALREATTHLKGILSETESNEEHINHPEYGPKFMKIANRTKDRGFDDSVGSNKIGDLVRRRIGGSNPEKLAQMIIDHPDQDWKKNAFNQLAKEPTGRMTPETLDSLRNVVKHVEPDMVAGYAGKLVVNAPVGNRTRLSHEEKKPYYDAVTRFVDTVHEHHPEHLKHVFDLEHARGNNYATTLKLRDFHSLLSYDNRTNVVTKDPIARHIAENSGHPEVKKMFKDQADGLDSYEYSYKLAKGNNQ